MRNKLVWQRKGFNQTEIKILTVLYNAEKPLSTYRIAEKSGMSWPTAKKYLRGLYRRKYLRRGKYGKSIYWWIRYDIRPPEIPSL